MTDPTSRQNYHTIWTALFLGRVVSYIDRSITEPVITWMIANKVAFMGEIANPHAFGGLIGNLFFAGCMLTQFPGGYFGDKIRPPGRPYAGTESTRHSERRLHNKRSLHWRSGLVAAADCPRAGGGP